MGLFTSKGKSRGQRKAEAKAHKRAAKFETKPASRHERKLAKAQLKHAKAGLEQERKLAKNSDKAQSRSEKNALKVAEANAKAAVDGKVLSPASIRRYLTVSRLLAPVVVPMVYRAAMATRTQITALQANRAGVPVAELNKFSGPGATLSARIAAADRSLQQLAAAHGNEADTKAFVATMTGRLSDLSNAVTAAEHMPPTRRRKALSAISHEVGAIDSDILARLGVRA